VHTLYLPHLILSVLSPDHVAEAALPEPLRGKVSADGRPTAYVCRQFTCSPPVTSPEALRALLKA
ncbi:MAG: hypothetical protein ABIO65_06325, partial [Nitrospiria bacterium]